MISKSWQLQEAKNRFCEVVDRALSDGPQIVTRHGKAAVVIISAAEYEATLVPRKSLVEILRECPEDLGEVVRPRDKQPARNLTL